MRIRSPEFISHHLADLYVSSYNRLDQHYQGSLKYGRLLSLQEVLVAQLFDLLSDADRSRVNQLYYNDYNYNPVKYFGPLSLVETRVQFDYTDEETGFGLQRGDYYLGIHLGFENGAKATSSQVRKAFGRMAVYLSMFSDRLPSDMIVGLTYEELANASRRYGFQVTGTPLPEKAAFRLSKLLEHPKARIPYAPNPSLCFQAREAFLIRFSL